MSHSNDDKGGKPKPKDLPAESVQSGKRSGRAAFDSRGNSIWEWQLETGVYSRDVNTQKLEKLDLGELSIAESGLHPQLTDPESERNKVPVPGPRASQPPAKQVPQSGSKTGSSNPHHTSGAGSGIHDARGGINPYDSLGRPPGAGTDPYDNARAFGKRFGADAEPERRRTPADLRKLDQQIKEQRKKLKE